MFDPQRLIFLHGLFGSSQGFKARLLRSQFPEMVIPDFQGDLEERMAQLAPVLGQFPEWTVIGSSFGGLMAALVACRQPGLVRKLVLLAPALIWPDFAAEPPGPIDVPTLAYHGLQDDVIPLAAVQPLLEKVFNKLELHVVADDHSLHETVTGLDWPALLSLETP
jgi:pimeloyl-ACP methyl ester carboxylesterase